MCYNSLHNLAKRGFYLSDITLVLLGAGSATRFKMKPKKQWLYSGEKPVWLQAADHFASRYTFAKIIIVSSKEDIRLMKNFAPFEYIEGGSTRQASLANALQIVTTPYVLVSDIARCCIDDAMVQRVLDAKNRAECIVPALPVVDTLYISQIPTDRSNALRVQTPQLSRTQTLLKAFLSGIEFTDESSAIAANGGEVFFVEGSENAHKLTTIEDLKKLSCLKKPSSRTLTGFGIDIHPFETGKTMMLCGTQIDVPYGFKAHSDGDVAIHALIDAILGAAGFGDIGEFYPDNDAQYAGIDSRKLLEATVATIRSCGLVIGNVDLSIIAQIPKISPYKERMRHNLAQLLGINANFVNIKATTAEELGFLGRKEGIAVQAVANLTYFDWTNE